MDDVSSALVWRQERDDHFSATAAFAAQFLADIRQWEFIAEMRAQLD
jgi:hypothetical protein